MHTYTHNRFVLQFHPWDLQFTRIDRISNIMNETDIKNFFLEKQDTN